MGDNASNLGLAEPGILELRSELEYIYIYIYNNNTQLVTRHMSVNAYSYIYERTESQARTGLSVTVGFIVQMSVKLFFERLLC